jgi:hypothetical protein
MKSLDDPLHDREVGLPEPIFIIARDGKIAAVYLFFDELPAPQPGA